MCGNWNYQNYFCAFQKSMISHICMCVCVCGGVWGSLKIKKKKLLPPHPARHFHLIMYKPDPRLIVNAKLRVESKYMIQFKRMLREWLHKIVQHILILYVFNIIKQVTHHRYRVVQK